MRGISWLAEELLAFQEGLCSVEVGFMCGIYVQFMYAFIYKECLNITIVDAYVERYSASVTFGLMSILNIIIIISRNWI